MLICWGGYLFILHISFHLSSCPVPTEHRWKCIGLSPAGKFVYLTVNIFTAEFAYWTACVVLEFAPRNLATSDYFARLRFLTTFMSIFMGELGIMLCLLFMKFNWYNKAWVQNVWRPTHKEQDRRGVDGVEWNFQLLVTHVPSLPIAFADVLLVKSPKDIVSSGVTLSSLALLNVVYFVLMVSWFHTNKRITNIYPYPILDKMFARWATEIPFVIGIMLVSFLLGSALLLLVGATHP